MALSEYYRTYSVHDHDSDNKLSTILTITFVFLIICSCVILCVCCGSKGADDENIDVISDGGDQTVVVVDNGDD